jgi:hypothetical protein
MQVRDTHIGNNQGMLLDSSQALSSQLQRNIHQAAYYKCVGVDITLDTPEGVIGGTSGTVKGRLRYFAPTQGRCSAYRTAFKQMMSEMKNQGINPSQNKLYDFRVTLRDYPANYPLNNLTLNKVLNIATLDGINTLALCEAASVGQSLFDAHNEQVLPVETTPPNFSSGLSTQIEVALGQQTDFVSEEGFIQGGNPNFASCEMEEIPFVLAWDSGAFSTQQAVALQWRPDPALYIPLMLGQMEIVFDEINAIGEGAGEDPGVEINVAMHIAGWKSILGSPKSKRQKKR